MERGLGCTFSSDSTQLRYERLCNKSLQVGLNSDVDCTVQAVGSKCASLAVEKHCEKSRTLWDALARCN